MEEGDVTEDEEDEAAIVTDKDGSEPKGKQRKTTAASGPLAKGFQPARSKDDTERDNGETGWLSGPSKKDKRRKGVQEGNAPIDTGLSAIDAKENQSHKGNSNTDGWTLVTYQDYDHNESDAEPTNPILTPAQQKANLFRSAFATDDATKSTFDAEKDQAAASEDEQELSTRLPGWGSWAGAGLTRSDKKANAQKKHNPLYKTKLPGVKREDRKDAKLENVIISEKQNRKGKHYMAPMLPHGYESKAQYERALRLPMGPEWSTKEVFQRATRPRVVVKPGAVVEAMERPLV
jgi:U3 small nucleolar RNA-associated protein 14